MKSALMREGAGIGDRTFVLVFEKGDEVMAGLAAFARDNRIMAGYFTGIGACSRLTVAFFDPADKQYRNIPIDEDVEVLALVGNLSVYEGGPRIHAHITVGRADGTTRGGHLVEAYIGPTLEVVLQELPVLLRREHNDEVGLPLITL
jgi:predicted DNA-binding protein with PD1-like motif